MPVVVLSSGLADAPVWIAGGALFTFLSGLFALLINTLLKLGARADSLNSQAVKDKLERIKQLEAELVEMKKERDLWFRKYDDERSGRQKTDTREDTPHEPPP